MSCAGASDDFERQIGAILFTRDVHGTRLTDEGALVVSAVERMEAASFDLMRAGQFPLPARSRAKSGSRSLKDSGHSGWRPALSNFSNRFLELMSTCIARCARPTYRDTKPTIAIHLSRPTALDVKLVRLGRMHLMFFASEKYIDIFGAPKTIEELLKHRLVMQVTDMATAKETFEGWFPGQSVQDLVVMKTNVSSANYWAVANGAGIGVFPTYACALGGKIIPLDLELRKHLDIWLSYHPGSGGIPRVRQMIDWLVEAFNSTRFPWFKDEFVHPTELNSVYKGESLTQLFGGFSTRTVKAE